LVDGGCEHLPAALPVSGPVNKRKAPHATGKAALQDWLFAQGKKGAGKLPNYRGDINDYLPKVANSRHFIDRQGDIESLTDWRHIVGLLEQTLKFSGAALEHPYPGQQQKNSQQYTKPQGEHK
jgi:hypothetical protein